MSSGTAQVLDMGPVLQGDEKGEWDYALNQANPGKLPMSQVVATRVEARAKVTKEMTIDQLRGELASAEDMDLFSFEPGTSQAEFTTVQETGEDKKRLYFRMQGSDGPKEFRVNRAAYLHMATMLGVPSSYVEKTPTALMLPHMNHWLHQRGLPVIGFGAVNEAIAVFSRGPLNPVSNYGIIDAVEDVMGTDLSVRHVSSDLWRTNFSIIRQNDTHPVRVGDVVRTGVSFDNSYAMARPLEISTYLERLICSNGSISVDNVFKFSRRGGGEGMDEWLRQSLVAAIEAADMEVDRLKVLADMRLGGHFTDALHSMFVEFNVPQSVRDMISTELIERAATEDGKIETMYDLYNAITDVASNNTDILGDGPLSRKLMRVSSMIAAHPALCGECHRVMA